MRGGALLALVVAAPSAALVFALVPLVLRARWTERASSRLVATSQLVVLLGWASLPVMGAFCLGEAIASWTGTPGMAGGPCWLGMDASSWRVLGYVLAAMALVPLLVSLFRIGLCARRSELGERLSRASSVLASPSGGKVFVLPTIEVAAYAGGLIRPRAVVTQGLVDPLTQKEKEAVCEHELAHVRLGHPRVLLLAAAIRASFGFLPPVRWAYDGLRRSLEASADEEALKWVGSSSLISALARVALTQASCAVANGGSSDPFFWLEPGVNFGDPEHLRYRLRKLQLSANHSSRAANLALTGVIALSVTVLSLSSCVFFNPSLSLAGLLACTLVSLGLACRPVFEVRGMA